VHEPTGACRSCGTRGLRNFLSLGETPLANALLTESQLAEPEPRYPLDVAFCSGCSLVQVVEEVPPERLFAAEYPYFSSFSDELLRHAREHALELIASRGLGAHSLVVEIGSNDGYMLRNFAERGIPVLGIDPAPEQAAAARDVRVPTLERFFGADLARELRAAGTRADVVVANNVMAHTPHLNGFVQGLAILLADDGIATIENPYVRELVDRCAFDTIYHEHFSYFSCSAVDALMRRHGLWLNRVDAFPLHGGSLRWTVGRTEAVESSVRAMVAAEAEVRLTDFSYYAEFGARVERLRVELRGLLERLRAEGARIAAYGAAAKGATLLNSIGARRELVDFVVDRNVHKQGLFMPGVHLPIASPDRLLEEQPDYLLLLAWNFKEEIMAQQAEYARRGGRFVVPVPEPAVVG
jgi:SAM-dependent methyltransferase